MTQSRIPVICERHRTVVVEEWGCCPKCRIEAMLRTQERVLQLVQATRRDRLYKTQLMTQNRRLRAETRQLVAEAQAERAVRATTSVPQDVRCTSIQRSTPRSLPVTATAASTPPVVGSPYTQAVCPKHGTATLNRFGECPHCHCEHKRRAARRGHSQFIASKQLCAA